MHSLHGLRVLNTRPVHQAKTLTDAIIAAGGVVIECPTQKIEAVDNDWLATLPPLEKIDYALFISANAVHFSIKALHKQKIVWPQDIKVIAIGKATAYALQQYQIHVSDMPSTPSSEDILALDCLQRLKNQTMLLFKGIGGRLLIEQELMAREAQVVVVPVYQRVMPDFSQHWLNTLWQTDGVDVIVFTSEQSMNHLFTMFDPKAHHWLMNKPCLVISSRLAQSAARLSIKNIYTSSFDQIINTLARINSCLKTTSQP